MLIILALLFVSFGVIPCLAYKYDRDCFIGWALVPNVIISIILVIVVWISYDNYVNMKQRLTNFNTYADAIISYEKLAKLDTTKPGTVGPLTDLKYQNYQRGVKDLIQDLRNSCILYNRTLISKRTLGNNIIFSWLIIMPDDNMKVTKFSDFLNVSNRGTI
jgi:hypothetical protein